MNSVPLLHHYSDRKEGNDKMQGKGRQGKGGEGRFYPT